MKSRLFSKNPYTEIEDFKKDLSRLLKLDSKVIESLPSAIFQLSTIRTEKERSDLKTALAKKLGIDESVIVANASIVSHFIKELSPTGDGGNDAVEDIVDDIIDSGIAPEESRKILKVFLERARKIATEEYQEVRKRHSYEIESMPTLVGISATVNMRAIFDQPFKSAIGAEKYKPKCEGLIPIGIVKLRLDSDSPIENVFFQVNQHELDILIEHLIATKKQMKTMIDYIGLVE